MATERLRRRLRLDMTMDEDYSLCASPDHTDNSYVADLLREVEIKNGPIPHVLLKAALRGPKNILGNTMPHWNKEGSEDSGIILDNDDYHEDFSERYPQRKALGNAISSNSMKHTIMTVDKHDNVEQVEKPRCNINTSMHEEIDGSMNIKQAPKDKIGAIDSTLENLKQTLKEIKKSDSRLMQQFLYIHDGIEEIKWAKEYCDELCTGSSIESLNYSSRDQISQSMDIIHEKWKQKRNVYGSRELLAMYESKLSLQNMLKSDHTSTNNNIPYELGWYGKTNSRTPMVNTDLMHPETYVNSSRRSSIGAIKFHSECYYNMPAGRRKSSAGLCISPTERSILETKYNESVKDSSDDSSISL